MAACIHCGGDTRTRDHVPSKVLLDEPYPENLPVVPSCKSCNEAFSMDEEYVACLVECTLAGSVQADDIRRKKIRRILRSKPALAAKLIQARKMTDSGTSFAVDTDRVRNVVLKLGRGHAAFELNEPQYDEPHSVSFVPLVGMPSDTRDLFETSLQSSLWPEAGSRAMQRLAVVWPAVPGWILVQPGRYRYLASVGDGVVIRMVISEYLACEVVWA